MSNKANPDNVPQETVLPELQMTDLDFDPRAQLDAAVRGREVHTGLTVDSGRTNLADDGLWSARNRESGGRTVWAHICDIPALIPANSAFARKVVERFSDQQMILKQKQGKIQVRNFPFDFMNDYASLHEGKVRPAVTVVMNLDYDSRLTSYEIKRTAFKNWHQCDFRPLAQQYKPIADSAKAWNKMAYRLEENRLYDMGRACDVIVGYDENIIKPVTRAPQQKESASQILVTEIMTLANHVVSDFFAANALPTPSLPQSKENIIEHVSNNPAFEREIDDLGWRIVDDYSRSCNPKTRVTSPMRLYSDYVAMQILTSKLDGRPISTQLAHNAERLTGIFNAAADDFRLSPERRQKRCARELVKQGGKHPFDDIGKSPSDMLSWRLQQLVRPEVSVRRLIMQDGQVYLVGMLSAQTLKKSWAVSHTYEHARELAASRMLQGMGQYVPNLS